MLYTEYLEPGTQDPLIKDGDRLVNPLNGHSFPIIREIPRFTESELYASAFGSQWLNFRKTQLDSHTGHPLSEDRLKRICKGDLSILKNKKILEVGCGAGRFSEIFLKSEANLFAMDLSNAVEAQYLNFSSNSNYHLCQADIRRLPFPLAYFDVVACLGVVQHTPDSAQTISQLLSYLKPGGILIFDHYTSYPSPPGNSQSWKTKIQPSYWLRKIMLHMRPKTTILICKLLTAMLWPFHRLAWGIRHTMLGKFFRKWLLLFSPIHDYHELYPFLDNKNLYQWAILDTHDGLTDYYKHMLYKEEIFEILNKHQLKQIDAWYGGNGIEVFAIK